MKYNNKHQTKLVKSPQKLSKLRQNIALNQKDLYRIFNHLLNSDLMVKGVVYPIDRKCGKANCKCAKSSYRHTSWYLSRSESGRMRVYYVKDEDISLLQTLTRQYKNFRKQRHLLVNIFRQIIQLINKIETQKTRTYPWKKRQK